MRKLVMDEECRTLFCDIDFGKLRMHALYDAKCSVWQSAQLRDHVERRPIVLSNVPSPRERHPMLRAHGFLRPCTASGDYKQMPLVSFNFLHTTGRSASRVFVHVQTEIKQPLLPVVCPLCTIKEVANQESESSSLPQAESVLLQFSSVSDCCDHIILCHLSLPGIPRTRFAKVAQFR